MKKLSLALFALLLSSTTAIHSSPFKLAQVREDGLDHFGDNSDAFNEGHNCTDGEGEFHWEDDFLPHEDHTEEEGEDEFVPPPPPPPPQSEEEGEEGEEGEHEEGEHEQNEMVPPPPPPPQPERMQLLQRLQLF